MTPDSLQISEELMAQLMTKYHVHHDFLQILLSFAAEAHAAEGASSNFSARPGKALVTTGNSKPPVQKPVLMVSDLMYQIRYSEANSAGSWRLRQTGVYHQYAASTNGPNVVIILQPTDRPGLDRRFAWLEKDLDGPKHARKALTQDPRLLHALIFSTYTADWRWYLRTLGKGCSEEVSIIATRN